MYLIGMEVGEILIYISYGDQVNCMFQQNVAQIPLQLLIYAKQLPNLYIGAPTKICLQNDPVSQSVNHCQNGFMSLMKDSLENITGSLPITLNRCICFGSFQLGVEDLSQKPSL